MKLSQFHSLAESLLENFQLSQNGWLVFTKESSNFFGLCVENRKRIYLDPNYIINGSEEHIADTLLHEIAHALVGCRNKHNHIWKAKAVEIGCTPKACSKREADLLTKNHRRNSGKIYIGVCQTCRHEYKMKRLPKVERYVCKCKGIVIFPINKQTKYRNMFGNIPVNKVSAANASNPLGDIFHD